MSCIAALAGACAIAFSQTPSLTLIPPPAGRLDTFASAMSSDGRFVTGYTITTGGGLRGYSWSRQTGVTEWGTAPGVPTPTQGTGISNDGATVAGFHEYFTGVGTLRGADAFVYRNGTYQVLGPVPANTDQIYARGMSGSGGAVVGSLGSSQALRQRTAYRWTEATGIQDVGAAHPGDFAAEFTGISRDGSTAFGYSAPGFDGGDAYTWTEAGGWRLLPVPGGVGSQHDARPNASNHNGSLVVGYVQPTGLDTSAVLWNNGVPTTLGGFGPLISMGANGVSDNGFVIAGGAFDGSTRIGTAVVWLNGSGPIALQDYLASLGVSVPGGWRLEAAGQVSLDGSTIIGRAKNGARTQAFIATIPSPAGLSAVACLSAILTPRRRRAPHATTR